MPRTFQQLPCLLFFIFVTYLQSPGHHASTSCSHECGSKRCVGVALTAQYCLPRDQPWIVILGLYQAHNQIRTIEICHSAHPKSFAPAVSATNHTLQLRSAVVSMRYTLESIVLHNSLEVSLSTRFRPCTVLGSHLCWPCHSPAQAHARPQHVLVWYAVKWALLPSRRVQWDGESFFILCIAHLS